MMSQFDIDALLTERAGYLRRGLKDRARQVEVALRVAGYGVADEPPGVEAAVPAEPENAAARKPRKR